MKDLKGKVAFVTGGSSGIGQGIVKVLAAEGMKVAFSYRRQDHLDQTMAYFRDKPQQAVHPDQVCRSGTVRVAAHGYDGPQYRRLRLLSRNGQIQHRRGRRDAERTIQGQRLR